jgi:hypothetical protein
MFINMFTSSRLETRSCFRHTLSTKHDLMSNFTYPFITCSQVTQNTFSIYVYRLKCSVYWPHEQDKPIYTSDKAAHLTGPVRLNFVDSFILTWNFTTAVSNRIQSQSLTPANYVPLNVELVP